MSFFRNTRKETWKIKSNVTEGQEKKEDSFQGIEWTRFPLTLSQMRTVQGKGVQPDKGPKENVSFYS